MGHLSNHELMLLIPAALIGLFPFLGGLLGFIAFFKVRRLEKKFKALSRRLEPPVL